MHVFFSGIGGSGIGPLAVITKQAGHEVSGSDIRSGDFLEYLSRHDIDQVHIGQTQEQITKVHSQKPIDWFVYSSALPKTDPNHPELLFCKQHNIKLSKRDELLNEILSQNKLKLVAIAGTHGKTTTTAMTIWAFLKLQSNISYSVGAKTSFADMGHFEVGSDYFVYECDEFDRNFLAFKPFFSIISGVSYDHHEIFPTKSDYNQAFRDFLSQSQRAILWQEDLNKLELDEKDEKFTVETYQNPQINQIKLPGLYNRRDGWLVVKAVSQITGERPEKLIEIISQFPGVSRRFEEIIENLYTDDAHTPEKIIGCMSAAKEMAADTGQKIVVIYEPLTNRRMHYMAADHHSVFEGASKIYWLPSYLAREDPKQKILTPEELIDNLSPELKAIAIPLQRDENLKKVIEEHLKNGDMVVAMTGGASGSLDEWLRQNFGAG